MLHILITVIHILACIFLVLVVLLQTGKGADMGAVFGGSSSTVFGSSGAGNFLTRLTTATAIIFMVTSLALTYFGANRRTETIFDSSAPMESAPLSAPAPANPPGVPPAPEPQQQQAEPPAPPAAAPSTDTGATSSQAESNAQANAPAAPDASGAKQPAK